jgi:hypothetical protein
MGRVGLIDITVGNAARLGASQRSTTRRCASHHIATQRASRWGHPGGSRAFSAGGPGTINTKDYCSKRKGFLMMVYQEKIVSPGSLPVLASEPPAVLLSRRTWPWIVVWIAAVAVIFGLIGAPLIHLVR